MPRTGGVAQRDAANATALPTRSATAISDAGLGIARITPIWNPMIMLAFFYALLFLIFVGAVACIVVRRRRRTRARARAAAAHPITAAVATTTTTKAGQGPEKGGQPLARDSGESDADAFSDANKTVTIAPGAGECKGSPASDGTGTGTKRLFYTCSGPSEDWATAPPTLPRSARYSSRTLTQMSSLYHGTGNGNASDVSVAQRERETSQVLVWLPSFQSNVGGGGTRPGSGAGAGVMRAEEGEQGLEKGSGKQENEKGAEEQELKREQEQEQGREQDVSEREVVSGKEDSDTEYGVAQ